MGKRAFEVLTSIKMTVVGGVFLAASLIFMLAGVDVPVDPAWATVIICGYPLLYVAIIHLFEEKAISSAFLIALAMIAASMIGEVFAAAEVGFIMAIGEILEEKTVNRAKKGLAHLISLTPETGRRITGDGEQIIATEHIRLGDILRVLPGEAIPVDGEIVSGNTSVDQSIITGESLPLDKTPGDEVFCGTINRFGSIDIRATKVGEDSSLQKLIDLVRQAENNQAPMQRIVDRWASWLVPAALAIAVATYLVTGDIVRAVTVLVVFCPCALVLATPTSIMAAIGQATKHGVIIKSGAALEEMGKVDTIAFDKTGTLTRGVLVVSDVLTFDEALSEQALISLAAAAESRSEHPLGKAVTAYAKEHGIAMAEPYDFSMIPGKGVAAVVDGRALRLGNDAFISDHGINIDARSQEALARLRRQGKATILIAADNALVGVVALSDSLRPTADAMVSAIKRAGTRAMLLTGDHAQAANYFAKQIGIDAVHSELLPAQKVERINALRQQGHTVCMIGDGVNDAPALKAANVGVAMGGMGSDIAVGAADIALIGDDLSKIPYLKRLSNATVRLIKINITLSSMAINFLAIILSVLGLMGPIVGALVHNVGAVLVVLNAALLYDRDYSVDVKARQKALA